MDCSLPGSSIHGISQESILEWVAISLFRGSSWPREQTYISHPAGGFFTTEPPEKSLQTVSILLLIILETSNWSEIEWHSCLSGGTSPGLRQPWEEDHNLLLYHQPEAELQRQQAGASPCGSEGTSTHSRLPSTARGREASLPSPTQEKQDTGGKQPGTRLPRQRHLALLGW